MALKPFTGEGRFECGLDEAVKGKVWAFTPVIGKHDKITLGVAIANEPGYIPVPMFWCHADTWDEMQAHADELNKASGLDLKTAERIVLSSMRKPKV